MTPPSRYDCDTSPYEWGGKESRPSPFRWGGAPRNRGRRGHEVGVSLIHDAIISASIGTPYYGPYIRNIVGRLETNGSHRQRRLSRSGQPPARIQQQKELICRPANRHYRPLPVAFTINDVGIVRLRMSKKTISPADQMTRNAPLTLNERLYESGILDSFAAAVERGDKPAMVAFLKAVEIDPIEAAVTADMILKNPKRHGYPPG
jgi:hypothetical protein